MSELRLGWDPRKARVNLAKHGVSFEEAADAIDDPLAVVRADEDHSSLENRYVLVGDTGAGRILTVIFTVSGVRVDHQCAKINSLGKESIYGRQTKDS